MAQASDTNKELISLLKLDDKGWNIALFENQNKVIDEVCANCHGVCCAAVELGCDHQDDDILLYCNDCLVQLIKNNDNKCPINSHLSPIISPSRAIRRKITKCTVLCPYSRQYKIGAMGKMDNEQHVIDTVGNDEKEGMSSNVVINNNDSKCNWKGSLNDLITKHIHKCTQQNNPLFVLNTKVKYLEIENKKLSTTVTALNQENQELRKQLNDQSIMMQDLLTQIEKNKIQKKDNYNEENKIDDMEDKENSIVFHLNDNTKKQLFLTNNGKTLNWKGSWSAHAHRAMIGEYLENDDEITIHFITDGTGDITNYSFGFISDKFETWITGSDYIQTHQAMVRGDGEFTAKDEFVAINKDVAKKQKPLLYWKKNEMDVVGISVNMTTKIGVVWNENNEMDKVVIKLPNTRIAIAVRVFGTSNKAVTALHAK